MELRYFIEGKEVTREYAEAAEIHGAKVIRGASGDTPERLGGGPGPWMEMDYSELDKINEEFAKDLDDALYRDRVEQFGDIW